MYNGIGLTTPRGTGTNGYVQRNFAAVKPSKGATAYDYNHLPKTEKIQRFKHKDIQLHEKKRKLDLIITLKREELLEQGLDSSTIDSIIQKLKENLNQKEIEKEEKEKKAKAEGRVLIPTKSLEDFGKAFGVGEGYQEGSAFDKELQEQKKLEAMQRRQAADIRRIKETLAKAEGGVLIPTKSLENSAFDKELQEQKKVEAMQRHQADFRRIKKGKRSRKSRSRSKSSSSSSSTTSPKRPKRKASEEEPILLHRMQQIMNEKKARDRSRLDRKDQQETRHSRN